MLERSVAQIEQGLQLAASGVCDAAREIYNKPECRAAMAQVKEQVAVVTTALAKDMLEHHADRLAQVAVLLPDGTYPVATVVKTAEAMGIPLDPKTAEILDGFQSLKKQGHHFELERSDQLTQPTDYGPKVPFHGTKDLHLDKTISFDVEPGENPRITNIHGASVHAHSQFLVFPINKDVKITDISWRKQPDGSYAYDVGTDLHHHKSDFVQAAADQQPVDASQVEFRSDGVYVGGLKISGPCF